MIPGEDINRAALRLLDSASAPDKPYYIEIQHRGRRILVTFNGFKYRPSGYKAARRSWTASSERRVN